MIPQVIHILSHIHHPIKDTAVDHPLRQLLPPLPPLLSSEIIIIVTGFIVPLALPVRRRLAVMTHLLCLPASGGGHSITHFLPKLSWRCPLRSLKVGVSRLVCVQGRDLSRWDRVS